MNQTIELTPAERIDAFAKAHNLTLQTEFVPFSQSRNRSEKSPSLNYRVTLQHDGRDILTTDYSMGAGHCPADKHKDRNARQYMIAFECEHGYRAADVRWGRDPEAYGGNPKTGKIEPLLRDVLYSLALDSGVLDAGGFESWAADLGYDADSRKAEAIYRACLDIALKLRSALGDDGLRQLCEACQDY